MIHKRTIKEIREIGKQAKATLAIGRWMADTLWTLTDLIVFH